MTLNDHQCKKVVTVWKLLCLNETPREDDVRVSNGRLFHHLIDEKKNNFFYAYQYERKLSKDS